MGIALVAGRAAARLLVESGLCATIAVVGLGYAFASLGGLPGPGLAAVPYWALGTFGIYSAHRHALARRRRPRPGAWRQLQAALAGICCAAVLALPLVDRDPALALLNLAALTAGALYSYRLAPGAPPLRELPLVKTLLPTLVVFAAIWGLPRWLAGELPATAGDLAPALWLACILLFNVVHCDLRDRREDAGHGIRSLPVLLGAGRTRALLRGLQLSLLLLSLLAAPQSVRWLLAGLCSVLPMEILLRLTPRRTPAHELLVEGLLLAPLGGLLMAE